MRKEKGAHWGYPAAASARASAQSSSNRANPWSEGKGAEKDASVTQVDIAFGRRRYLDHQGQHKDDGSHHCHDCQHARVKGFALHRFFSLPTCLSIHSSLSRMA